ncbi:cell surface hyaluronidase, partial [Meleagris gallopavo]|uniref:cell surface hyaluronidase n=1 Tax=Meleagris gallopavo TaxID=9103 RepID=UPI0012ABA0FB
NLIHLHCVNSCFCFFLFKLGVPISGFQVEPVGGVILNLLDDVSSWEPGDRIVVASTDYSMYQTEEFTLLPCPECTKHQVKVKEKPQYPHVGEVIDGVDMRAEVGVLTRNILIKGETENTCYREKECQFFSYDTFGGHIKILKNFTSVHLSYVELKQMGQQQIGSYPVHFHLCGDVDEKGGYSSKTYLDGLSIHHCFSRCVTIHATNGLLIKDTIGYDTLGHCFFIEDGIEQRNTFFHNLGLVTKPGTILPTDRNSTMCTGIRDKVYGSYVPVPATDCMAVSTFWISHPNNHLISNAAAGSQDAGIWYLFHKIATGDSHSLGIETKSELTPLGIFYNNRVHSNFKVMYYLKKNCPDQNPRLKNWSPGKDPEKKVIIKKGDLFRLNSDATVHSITIQDGGLNVRVIDQDTASVLEVLKFDTHEFSEESLKLQNLLKNRSPGRIIAIAVGDSAAKNLLEETRVTIQNLLGSRFVRGLSYRQAWALVGVIGGGNSSCNESVRDYENHSTGGKALAQKEFFTVDGQKFVVRAYSEWNDGFEYGSGSHSLGRLVQSLHETIPVTGQHKAGDFTHSELKNAKVYVQTWNGQNLSMAIVRDEYPSNPMVLRGINQKAVFQQYQPVVMLQKGYTIHWNGKAPNVTYLYLINFNKNDWIRIGLCYQPNTDFTIVLETFQRKSSALSSKVERYTPVSSMLELEKNRSDKKFYFDNSTGLLFLFLQAKYSRDGHSYCSSQGCERIKIVTKDSAKGVSNCMAKAYPKYYQGPAVIKQMPVKTTVPCTKCGTTQMVFTSDPHKNYLLVQINLSGKNELSRGQQAFISVNNTMFSFKDNGIFVVVVDACTGTVSGNNLFSGADIKRVGGYLKSEIPQRSVVLLSTRGEVEIPNNLAEALKFLGTAKPPYLQSNGSVAFLGFRGNFKPSWIKLFTSPAGHGLIQIEKYIPLQLEEYGCTRAIKSRRKDLELLNKATRSH